MAMATTASTRIALASERPPELDDEFDEVVAGVIGVTGVAGSPKGEIPSEMFGVTTMYLLGTPKHLSLIGLSTKGGGEGSWANANVANRIKKRAAKRKREVITPSKAFADFCTTSALDTQPRNENAGAA